VDLIAFLFLQGKYLIKIKIDKIYKIIELAKGTIKGEINNVGKYNTIANLHFLIHSVVITQSPILHINAQKQNSKNKLVVKGIYA
jgi:hypothetical protein